MKLIFAAAIVLCAIPAVGVVSAQPSGLGELCAAQARGAGLQGAAARSFARRCARSPFSAIVFADPVCRRVAQATMVSLGASARLGDLSAAQRGAGEDCRIEKTMFDVNDSMLALIDKSPSHCGHSAAGIELMRASQRAMRGMGC